MADFQLFTTIRYDPALVNVGPESHVPEWNRMPSPWYMLDYHRDRMLRAAEHFGWAAAVTTLAGDEGMKRLEQFVAQVASTLGDSAPHRVKILLDESGCLSSEHSATPAVALGNLFPTHLPKPDDSGSKSQEGNEQQQQEQPPSPWTPAQAPAWDVLVDSDVSVHSAFTHHKTTNRHMYDDARWRRQLAPTTALRDVLLVNQAHGCVMESSISTPYFWRRGRWVTPPVSRGGFRQWHGSGGNDGTSRRWALAAGLAEEEMVPVASLRDGEECWLSNGLRGFMFGHVKIPPNSEALFY